MDARLSRPPPSRAYGDITIALSALLTAILALFQQQQLSWGKQHGGEVRSHRLCRLHPTPPQCCHHVLLLDAFQDHKGRPARSNAKVRDRNYRQSEASSRPSIQARQPTSKISATSVDREICIVMMHHPSSCDEVFPLFSWPKCLRSKFAVAWQICHMGTDCRCCVMFKCVNEHVDYSSSDYPKSLLM